MRLVIASYHIYLKCLTSTMAYNALLQQHISHSLTHLMLTPPTVPSPPSSLSPRSLAAPYQYRAALQSSPLKTAIALHALHSLSSDTSSPPPHKGKLRCLYRLLSDVCESRHGVSQVLWKWYTKQGLWYVSGEHDRVDRLANGHWRQGFTDVPLP